MMFCRFCGSTLSDDSSFCHSCGQSLANAPAPTSAIAAAPAQAQIPPAPAASPQAERVPLPQKKSKVFVIVWRLVGVVVLLWLLWVFLGTTAMKEIAHLPADLKSDSFGLPAASWKSVVIEVPYNGSLTVSVQVASGNPVRVFLTDNAGLAAFREDTDGRVNYFAGFYSDKTRSFDHTARVSSGQYQLVVYDPSYGFLSSSSSDISLKVHIDP
jgi:hypothetical protein